MVWAIGLRRHRRRGGGDVGSGQSLSGRSAQNGYSAALLAQAGFIAGERGSKGRAALPRFRPRTSLSKITSARRRLRPPREYVQAFPVRSSSSHDRREHSASRRAQVDPDAIVAVRLRVAPLVLDLCNQQNITRGIQGSSRVSRRRGGSGPRAAALRSTPTRGHERQIKRVRENTTAVATRQSPRTAYIEVELASGQRLTKLVEESLGNLRRPWTDRQLRTSSGQASWCSAAESRRSFSVLADRSTQRHERARALALPVAARAAS